MIDIDNPGRLDELLVALSEQLEQLGQCYELVVVGGSGLLALRLVDRTTKDVDVVALREADLLRKAKPLPTELGYARDRVARDFGLAEDWLNPGAADLMDFGLPDGFLGRVHTQAFGDALTVHFASRLDQIHFKLYALVDQGLGKHDQDLRALEPTHGELVQAARWTRTHDPSPGFREMLGRALRYLGVEDADLGS
ncbi:MAG: DUF6036 family nucleotidyltransferase [Solirubrobacteraceae bacterium]